MCHPNIHNKSRSVTMYSSRKYSYPPQGRFTEIARGEAKIYNGKYKAKPKIPREVGRGEGGGVQTRK